MSLGVTIFGSLPALSDPIAHEKVFEERSAIDQALARVAIWEDELARHRQVVAESVAKGPNEYGNFDYSARSPQNDGPLCWGCLSPGDFKLWAAERTMSLNGYVAEARAQLQRLQAISGAEPLAASGDAST